MKTKSLYSILIILFNLQFSHAATVTWNGGFGFWNQAARWDTGTVPSANDQVIINNGFVLIPQNYNAAAKGVQVNSNSAFRIEFNAHLELHNGDVDIPALKNEGITFNFGTIDIDDYYGTNPNYHVGLYNSNFFRNFAAGEIIVTNTNNKVIFNHIDANFINDGLIETDLSNKAWNTGIGNVGSFENRQTGIINIDNGFYGIDSSPLATKFHNSGKINISDTEAAGFICKTEGRNFSSGTIQLVACDFQNDDHFINDGLIIISNFSSEYASGLINTEYFENYGGINISNAGLTGLFNHSINNSFPVFDNDGTITISQNVENSILNEGMLFNFPAGYIETDNYLNSGELINYGIFKNTYNGKNNHSCILTNKGLFNDKYGKLSSSTTTNTKIIVAPIEGPIVAGQAISNILDVASTNDIIFAPWKNEIVNGNTCGLYLAGLNRFHPNSYAANEAEIHARFIISSVGNDKWLDIVVLNPTNSIVQDKETKLNSDPGGIELLTRDQKERNNAFTVFPNPCSSHLYLTHDKQPNSKIEIYNNQGRLVYHQKTLEEKINPIVLPENLSSGSYTIRLITKDKLVATKIIQVIK